MPLTPAQKVTLKNHALANTAVVAAAAGNVTIQSLFQAASLSTGDAVVIAEWYNLMTAPAQWAWHFSRSRMEQRRAVMNTTGAGAQLDALTGSKREALLWGIDDTTDCRLAGVRACIEDWCGSQNVLKAAIIDSYKRHLNNLEKVFSAGGLGTLASPHDFVFEGTVNHNDIDDVHGVPV